jgi:hypothetical protein
VRPPLAACAVALLASTLIPSCHIPDSRAWNLNELHDESTHHKYTGAIESNLEYFFRHQVAGSLAVGGASFADKVPVAVPDPAATCLENIVELESYGDHDPRIAAMQVEWASRLAVSDPWRLSRERAVASLGRATRRLSAGVPQGLPQGAVPAGPGAVSEALAGLVRASRPILQRGTRATETERLDLASAIEVVTGLTLDLEGARRMLHAAIDLASAVGLRNEAGKPLIALSEELQRRCVRLALAAALKDREPLVRAAAIEASVRGTDLHILDPILVQLAREPATEVLVRAMDLVRELGLPEGPIEGSKATPEQARDIRLAAIYDLLQRPEGEVRVAAMRTLAQVSGTGNHSLREEDWQAWWNSRREKPAP